jgi:hypothetical protein
MMSASLSTQQLYTIIGKFPQPSLGPFHVIPSPSQIKLRSGQLLQLRYGTGTKTMTMKTMQL